MGSGESQTGLMHPVWVNRGDRVQLVLFGRQALLRRFGSRAIAEVTRAGPKPSEIAGGSQSQTDELQHVTQGSEGPRGPGLNISQPQPGAGESQQPAADRL